MEVSSCLTVDLVGHCYLLDLWLRIRLIRELFLQLFSKWTCLSSSMKLKHLSIGKVRRAREKMQRGGGCIWVSYFYSE